MLEALHRELVRARDEVDVVRARELPHGVAAEQEPCAARREAPARDVCSRVSERVGTERGRAPSGSDHSKSFNKP